MNIHIVLWQDNHILPRMTQWLVDRNGWTVSEGPDYSADVNYFMPYLKYDFDLKIQGKTAAWFTHYEKGTAWKEDKWWKAAIDTDAQIITAPMYYDDDRLGNPIIVTPGVDRDIYQPGQKPNNSRPVIGTCGVGHPRKGPKLLIDLYYGGITCDLNIVGIQWPFPHRELPNELMPDWYRQLDIYLCTSNIEGIPAPVLEALASDTKVVIPYGVGICDQLPEMEGLRHYDKNNGNSMLRAIQQVIEDKPSEGALRDVTADYTIDHWCDSHMMAMERILDAAIPV